VNEAAARQRTRDMVALPLVALELLTVLRLRPARLVGPRLFGRAQAFFPAVGLLLGCCAAGADALARPALGGGASGWLTVALLLLLTGGLHADGQVFTLTAWPTALMASSWPGAPSAGWTSCATPASAPSARPACS